MIWIVLWEQVKPSKLIHQLIVFGEKIPIVTKGILWKNHSGNKEYEQLTCSPVNTLVGSVDYKENHVTKVLNTV